MRKQDLVDVLVKEQDYKESDLKSLPKEQVEEIFNQYYPIDTEEVEVEKELDIEEKTEVIIEEVKTNLGKGEKRLLRRAGKI